jgi:hypothetical protein
VRTGDDVAVRATRRRDEAILAAVSRIAPEDDETTRTMTVYVEIEQDPRPGEGRLAPGQFVRGLVSSSEGEIRYVVPRRAVKNDRVLLVENDTMVSGLVEADFEVEATFPALGLPDEQWVVLADPLPDGALVVVNAARALPEGVRVTPVPVSAPPAAASAPGIGAAPGSATE